MRCCETSFAPEQQLSANTGNENLVISQSAKFLLLLHYCLNFLDLARISHQVTARVFFIEVKKNANSPVWELEDKVSQLHALEGHGLPPDTTAGAIHQCLKKGNKGGGLQRVYHCI